MTASETETTGVIEKTAQLVDLALRACEAYQRADLAARLRHARRRLHATDVHVVVVGEFKKGKSSLVNALVGTNLCPVNDDLATAVPTQVRYGEQAAAVLLRAGEPPTRDPIALEDIRAHVVESDAGHGPEPLAAVEVSLPRKLLAGGLVLVDTPGVGGLNSTHATASLAATSMANAVVFVTDASQELTRNEVEFLHRVREMCPTVACVITKTDFYPAWRKVRDLNQGHVGGEFPVMAVSSALRSRAVAVGDRDLNRESGFGELVAFVSDRVGAPAAKRLATECAADVVSAMDQISAQFQAERAALADPDAAQRIVDDLAATRARTEALRGAAARWSQTLNDGIADLTADVDHDLRSRIRKVVEDSDDVIADIDPADSWDTVETWLQSRTSAEVLANYTLLRDRAEELSREVAEHFREASGAALDQLAVYDPSRVAARAGEHKDLDLTKMTVGKQAMVALKNAYTGGLMFTMLGSLLGLGLGPIGLGIGLIMGHKGLRDEKKRQLQNRRSQAKNSVRRYCDEVNFVVGKDSRDTLRRIQRQLRDHYAALAEELNKSTAEALKSATDGAKTTKANRAARLRDLDAELARLAKVRQMAGAIAEGAA
ncbi:dynamin family protein [Micromonospora sp. WMMA1363]|uniref:dynamin family protein n=1 Tax=Micromonospora sp. WMMA1363 TaxID=3053985 RepID=UPI00259C90A6|nr:dynamin family protein [Micromonospora sp. WMMA1363]MDM4719501.1 dynamin family protein [Micromonospora sp. WMMA1363]